MRLSHINWAKSLGLGHGRRASPKFDLGRAAHAVLASPFPSKLTTNTKSEPRHHSEHTAHETNTLLSQPPTNGNNNNNNHASCSCSYELSHQAVRQQEDR